MLYTGDTESSVLGDLIGRQGWQERHPPRQGLCVNVGVRGSGQGKGSMDQCWRREAKLQKPVGFDGVGDSGVREVLSGAGIESEKGLQMRTAGGQLWLNVGFEGGGVHGMSQRTQGPRVLGDPGKSFPLYWKSYRVEREEVQVKGRSLPFPISLSLEDQGSWDSPEG